MNGKSIGRRKLAALVWGVCCAMDAVAVCGQATTNPEAIPGPAGGRESGQPDAPARQRDEAGNVVGPARAGWWNDAVFYQVFVRSFADSREGPLAGDGIGDFQGLIERLDELNDGDAATGEDLGITAIWLMPVNPSPSYHGYDVTDFYSTNPEYGTVEDFRRLMAECHRRGIRVIVDLVMNHISDEHPWFVGAADPADDKHSWFIWSQKDPGYRGPWNQRVWHRSGRARGDGRAKKEDAQGGASGTSVPWYYGIFSGDMPDVNYRDPAASAQMLDVAKFWLEPARDAAAAAVEAAPQSARKGMGADGLRLDAIRHLIEDGKAQDNTPETHAWLRKFRKEYKAANPEAFAIGEVWSSSEIASSYVGEELDAAFEFDLAGAMVESARSGDAGAVKKAQEKVLALYPPNQYGRFLTNHDQKRVMTELKGDDGAMRMAAAMLLLGPGIPFIYYGEELGMPGDKPDPDLRTPMPWTGENGSAGFTRAGVMPWRAVTKEAARINVERLRGEGGSLWNWYRRLIALRMEHEALRSGMYEALKVTAMTAEGEGGPSEANGVYAFVRTSEDGKERVLTVINLGREAVRGVDVQLPNGTGMKRVGVLLAERIDEERKASLTRSHGLTPVEGGVTVTYAPVGDGELPARSMLVELWE